jgi:hypothetical protein
MMISVKWDDEPKTIIRVDYHPPIESWMEYDNAIDQSYELAKSVQRQVYIIHNAGKARMPSGSPIPHVRRALFQSPPNIIGIAVVEDAFASHMVSAMANLLLRGRVRFVKSLEDAYALIYALQQKAG